MLQTILINVVMKTVEASNKIIGMEQSIIKISAINLGKYNPSEET